MRFSGKPWLDENNFVGESASQYKFNLVIPEFKESTKKGSRKRAVFLMDEEIEMFLNLFEILLYANGSSLKNKGYVSILFQENRMSHLYSDSVSVTFLCFISITDSTGESRFLQSFAVTRNAGKDIAYPAESCSLFGFERFVSCNTLLNNMDEFISEGCLTIHCDITLVESFRIDSWHSRNLFLAQSCNESITAVVTPENITKYKIMFDTPLFYYLQSESRYFQRIAEIPMQEATSQCLYICSDEYNTFHKLGRFLSCGSLQHVESLDDLFQLYTIADKYEILRLQHLCAELIENHLTIENAADIFVLADMHSDQYFKAKVMQYIRSFLPEVKSTVSWISLIEEREDLAKEVLDMKDIKLYNQESILKEIKDQEKVNDNFKEIESPDYFS